MKRFSQALSLLIIASFLIVNSNFIIHADFVPFTVTESKLSDITTSIDGIEIKVDLPSGTLTVVDASQFGMSTSSGDNTVALSSAFDYCASNPNTKLVFQKGTYRFCSNTTAVLDGANNVMIDGQDSEFVFASKPQQGYLLIKNSEKVEIKNLVLDWDWNTKRLASVVKVVATNTTQKTIDFQFPELTNVSADLSDWRDLNQCDPNTYTPGTEGGKEYWEGSFYTASAVNVSSNVLRVTYQDTSLSNIQTDETYLIRHDTYGTDALTVSGCSNIAVRNITDYSNPGMAFKIVNETHNYEVMNCKVGIRPGSGRHISATADALHAGNTMGYGRIENCDFSGTGDDTININDTNGIVVFRNSDTNLTVRNTLSCVTGDTIIFRNADLSPINFTAKVLTITNGNGENYIEFDRALPTSVVKDCVLSNAKYNSGNYIIRNNYFHENRARGALIGVGNGLIENNRFYKTQGAALLINVDIYVSWSEGVGFDNLMVRNNTFEKCNVNDWTSLIEICTSMQTSYPAFTNLTFDSNELIDFPSRAFHICSAGDVTITNNKLINPTARKTELATRATISIEKSQSINISSNIWERSLYVSQPMVITIEPNKAGELASTNNTLGAYGLSPTNTWLNFDTLTTSTLSTKAANQSGTGILDLSLDSTAKNVGHSLLMVPIHYDDHDDSSVLVMTPQNNVTDRTGEEGVQFWCKRTDGYSTTPGHPSHIDVLIQIDIPSRSRLTAGSSFTLTDTSGNSWQSYVQSDSTIRIPANFEGTVKFPFSSLSAYNYSTIDTAHFNAMYFVVNNDYFRATYLYVDSICTYNQDYPVTSISVNKSNTTLCIGEREELTATILPLNAGNNNIEWFTSDSSVATVDENGLVTAVSKGSAIITVSSQSGRFSAECSVNVNDVLNNWIDFDSLSSSTLSDYAYQVEGYGNMELYLDSDIKDIGQSLLIVPKHYIGADDTSILTMLPQNNLPDRTGEDGIQFWVKHTAGYNYDPNRPRHIDIQIQLDIPSRCHLVSGSTFVFKDSSGTTWQGTVQSDNTIRIAEDYEGIIQIPFSCFELYDTTNGVFDLSQFNRTYFYINNEYFKDKYLYLDSLLTYNNISAYNICLNKSTTSIVETGEETLTATILPQTTTNKTVTWTSSNTEVATVDQNGLVTAVSTGTATVAVTAADGGFTAYCTVTVASEANTWQNFDTISSLPSSYAYPYYVDGNNLGITEYSFSTAVKDRGKSLLLTPKYYADHQETSTFIFKPQGSADVSGSDGIEFWCKRTNGYNGSLTSPQHIDVLIQFDLPWRCRIYPGSWVTLKDTNGNSWQIQADGSSNIRIPGNFEGRIKISFNDIKIYGNESAAIDKTQFNAVYFIYNNNWFRDTYLYVDSIKTYVSATGVSLNKPNTCILETKTETLTATVFPLAATNKSIIWSSGNTAIATVDSSGKITGVTPGTTTVTATTADGGFISSCTVTVESAVKSWLNFDTITSLPSSYAYPYYVDGNNLGITEYSLSTAVKDIGQSILLTPKYFADHQDTSTFIFKPNGSTNVSAADGIEFWCKRTNGYNGSLSSPQHIDVLIQFDLPWRCRIMPGSLVTLTDTNGSSWQIQADGSSNIRIPGNFEGRIKILFNDIKIYGNESASIDKTQFNAMYFIYNNNWFRDTYLYVDTINTYIDID